MMKINDPIAEHLSLEEAYLCLDFVNTLDWRTSDHPEEMLNSPEDLIHWAEVVSLVTPEEAQALRAQVEARPEEAEKIFRRAVDLREAIARVLLAAAEDESPAQADLDLLNREIAVALAHGVLTRAGAGFTLEWKNDPSRLEGLLYPIARSAADLLTGGDPSRVRQCEGAGGCGWLFYDTTRNHSRRWCSMGSCGNRAKAQRHYHKVKAG